MRYIPNHLRHHTCIYCADAGELHVTQRAARVALAEVVMEIWEPGSVENLKKRQVSMCSICTYIYICISLYLYIYHIAGRLVF
jgi:hypothetical protein